MLLIIYVFMKLYLKTNNNIVKFKQAIKEIILVIVVSGLVTDNDNRTVVTLELY